MKIEEIETSKLIPYINNSRNCFSYKIVKNNIHFDKKYKKQTSHNPF
jgi:hypothetical protein